MLKELFKRSKSRLKRSDLRAWPDDNVFVEHNRKILLFWSQKCACTSIAHWFSKKILEQDYSLAQLRQSDHCISYSESTNLVDAGYTTIFLCRNPYNRSVSAFTNKFYWHPRRGGCDQFDNLEEFSKELVRYAKLEENFCGISFIQYLNTVRDMMAHSVFINRHWERQIPRHDNYRFKPDFLIKQESFKQDLDVVNDHLNIPPWSSKPINASSYQEDFIQSKELLDRVPSAQILENKIALNKENLLSSEAKLLIQEIYAEDFSFFNYDLT